MELIATRAAVAIAQVLQPLTGCAPECSLCVRVKVEPFLSFVRLSVSDSIILAGRLALLRAFHRLLSYSLDRAPFAVVVIFVAASRAPYSKIEIPWLRVRLD